MTDILDVDEHKKRCTDSDCEKREKKCTNYYCKDSYCDDSDCEERNKICTNSDCEDSYCDDSNCEAGMTIDDFIDKYDGNRVFDKHHDGTISFYTVKFECGYSNLCELKADEQITKIDNSKWEIKYVNRSDQQTGIEEYIRPRNIKHTYPCDRSSEHSVIVNFNPMITPSVSSSFDGERDEGMSVQRVYRDLSDMIEEYVI